MGEQQSDSREATTYGRGGHGDCRDERIIPTKAAKR